MKANVNMGYETNYNGIKQNRYSDKTRFFILFEMKWNIDSQLTNK